MFIQNDMVSYLSPVCLNMLMNYKSVAQYRSICHKKYPDNFCLGSLVVDYINGSLTVKDYMCEMDKDVFNPFNLFLMEFE